MSIFQRTRRPEHICFGGRQRADEQCSPLRRERGRGFFAPLRMTNRSPVPPTCPVPVSHPARQPHTAGAGGDGGQAMLVPTREDAIPLTSYLLPLTCPCPLSERPGRRGRRPLQASLVTYQFSILNSQLSPVNCHLSLVGAFGASRAPSPTSVTCHLSILKSQLSILNSQFSTLTCQLSPVTCHLSLVTCQL